MKKILITLTLVLAFLFVGSYDAHAVDSKDETTIHIAYSYDREEGSPGGSLSGVGGPVSPWNGRQRIEFRGSERNDSNSQITYETMEIPVEQPTKAEIIKMVDGYPLEGSRWIYRFQGWEAKISPSDKIADDIKLNESQLRRFGWPNKIDVNALLNQYKTKFQGSRTNPYGGSYYTVYLTFIGKWEIYAEPIEYEKNLYVKFVDENGNLIKGGTYTDQLTSYNTVPYTVQPKSWWIHGSLMADEDYYLRPELGTGDAAQSPRGGAMNIFNSDQVYTLTSACRITGIDDKREVWESPFGGYNTSGRYICHFQVITPDYEEITFVETSRPAGYKPLGGPVKVRFRTDIRKIQILEDPAKVAKVKGDTLYITYKEKQPCEINYTGSEKVLDEYTPKSHNGYELQTFKLKRPSKEVVNIGDDIYYFDGWELSEGKITHTDGSEIQKGGRINRDTTEIIGLSEKVSLEIMWRKDTLPKEFEKNVYVKFVDDSGKVVSGGRFTDGKDNDKPWVRKTTMYDLREDKLIEKETLSPVGQGKGDFKTDEGYSLTKYLKIAREPDAITVTEFENTADPVEFTETKTPTGYLPLGGSIKLKFDLEKETVEIEGDDTGRAYVKDNTLYVVYQKDTSVLGAAKLKAITELEAVNTDNNEALKIIESSKRLIDKAKSEGEVWEVLRKAKEDIKDLTGVYYGEYMGVANLSAMTQSILTAKGDKNMKESSYAPLRLMEKKAKAKYIKIKWDGVSGAMRYSVYGAQCGKKYVKLATVTGRSYKATNIDGKKLKKNKYYKFIVVAETDDKALAVSKTVHIKTGENIPKVKVNKKSAKVNVGSFVKIKAEPKKGHVRIRYDSSDPNVAIVTSSGRIYGIKAGQVVIYCYAENGKSKAVRVTVK